MTQARIAKKILIVEDEATQALLLTSSLSAHGFQVCSAMNGEDGLRKAFAERPDLVLMDIILPRMTGVELCRRLKEAPETRDIPVILVTASGMRNLEARCKLFGVDACVAKPYEMPDLIEKIQQLLGGVLNPSA
ncbi:MAG: response regulator [Candidatus Omnitrophica bacterium]|nr:response regulator [Candidatus Omnitrophota bacterium]